MTPTRTPSWLLWLGGSVAFALLGMSTWLLVTRWDDAPPSTTEATRPSSTSTMAAPPSPGPPGSEILDAPGIAARFDAETLLAVGRNELGNSPLAGAWSSEVERPVYVVKAVVGANRDLVVGDQVLAVRLDEPAGRVTLRFLPGAEDLGTPEPTISATVDGQPATTTLDRGGALLHVDLGRVRSAGEALRLRLTFQFEIPAASTLGGAGPVGYGLISRDTTVTVLSHWLPLLTFDTSPLQARGDLGSFPPAIWSVEVSHPGVLVTGGEERGCVVFASTCTRSLGGALRDMGMVVLDDAEVSIDNGTGHQVRVVHDPDLAAGDVAKVLAETVASVQFFEELFGPLAWSQTDVVGTPLSRGAAGMEYPGMFILRDDLWGSHEGGFGTYVIAHEVAHQWFHALVGNSSLSDPVIDEAVAQYLSVLFYADQYGDDAADDLAATMLRRWANARADGSRNDPPAQGLADFESDAAYGAIVYGRAPFALIEAERTYGRDLVIRFLAEVVHEYGLGKVTVDDVLLVAGDIDEGLQGRLHEWWLSDDPSLDETE